MFIVLGTLALGCIFIGLAGYFISGPKYKGAVSDHFDGRRFINPGRIKAKGFREVLKWMVNRKQGEWKEVRAGEREKPASRFDNGIRITVVNHSTFFIQVDGLNILTDPAFSEG